MVSKLEADYQQELTGKIYDLFPERRKLVDIIVYITDPNYIQGIPDLLILVGDKWAFLEVKLSEKSKQQPNQEWYINNWGKYVYASFIYPEIEEGVLNALQQALRARR